MSDERAFIEALRRIAGTPAARGLADDCAVFDMGERALVLTHDMMVEGVHWLPGQAMHDVAWKLVAVNLSDLAAKGATPLGILVGHTLGEDDAGFLAGLEEASDTLGAPLWGGDTVSHHGGARTLGLTAIGQTEHRPVPSRGGAKPGDAVCITGPVGGAMIGFESLRDEGDTPDNRRVTQPYRRPTPLLSEGRALAPLASAIMDVSDGLLLDASRMAEASGVTLALDRAAIPIAAPEDRRDEALRWGDDYQLLFTVSPEVELPIPAHRIGVVHERGEHAVLLDGEPVSGAPGYEHRRAH
ncbi:thiamine-phosphate kinase [Erythrobacter sp. LQ02-29]|uniref:thiamine-phosphate kinase n=1 Tax=Erythrobacter sp. LQ02-29 TaxID=2920384 RepID=UPI001F4E9DA7|nr:thiamine-phosphate kinase [Erythrobacter sp. LQ02-29]